jgi:hypothetical protein
VELFFLVVFVVLRVRGLGHDEFLELKFFGLLLLFLAYFLEREHDFRLILALL